MAGKSRTVRLEEVDPDEISASDQAAQDAAEYARVNEDEGGELFRVTDEIRGTVNAKLMIVRTYPNTPDMAGHVGDMTPGEFSIERMRELFGPGRYRVRVVGPKGFLPGGGPVYIAKMSADAPAATGGTAAGEIAALIKVMNEQQQAQARERSERQGKLIELAVPGLLTIIAAVLGKNTAPDYTALIAALKPAPGPTLTDLTTSLSNLRNLTEKPDAGTGQIETLFKILEAVKAMAGGDKEPGESNWIDLARDVIKEAIPAVRPMLENLQAQQTQQAQRMLPGPAMPPRVPMPGPANPSPSPSGISSPNVSTVSTVATPNSGLTPSLENSPSGNDDMLALYMPMIRAQLAKLTDWAITNKRVELYAEVFLEELPELVHKYLTPQQVLGYLNHPAWWQVITDIHPALKPYYEWSDAMRLELVEIITDQLKNEPAEDPPEVPEQIVDPLNGGQDVGA